MGVKKPRGILTARKLKDHRKHARWADKDFRKSRKFKSAGASHVSGVVLARVGIEAKQPNSAIRKCVRVQLLTGKRILAFVPHDGGMNYIDENDTVVCSGLGRSQRAVGDIPGVHYQVVKVSGVALTSLIRGKKDSFFHD